jgi:hypothetical protein
MWERGRKEGCAGKLRGEEEMGSTSEVRGCKMDEERERERKREREGERGGG